MDSYKPEGWPAVTPRLITADVPGLVDFLKRVFGATGEVQSGRPAEMAIADSRRRISSSA